MCKINLTLKEVNMEASKVLNYNYDSVEGSFIYYLHEESTFNKESFWEYYNCIRDITRQAIINGIDRDISRKINFTYRYVLECILYHFDPNDFYRIKRFPRVKYNLYLERLRYVVDGYYSGKLYDESLFGSELKNPIYDVKSNKNK
jgi:hypothetical protein